MLRADLDVKVFKLLSETDVVTLSQAAYREPDSDHFRRWEVAGAAHLDFHMSGELVLLGARDGIPLPSPSCGFPPFSRIPLRYVRNAALDHMVEWVQQNIEPPTAPDIELVTLGPPIVVARDTFGNALGGIRVSQHAVPTATNTGVNLGSAFCALFGSFQPFDAATLNALYPDHGTYVNRITQVANENVKDGYVLLDDAIATILDAARADVGKP